MRCIGTQQAAYQLIQKSSVTLVKSEQLLNLEGTKKGEEAVAALQEMAEMISIYRAAIIKGKGVEVEENAASFGSVPELLMSYLQTLSAASDIPASRFLGQAPGGLNATGDGDLENYYNNIAAYQETRLDPKYERLFDILGRSVLGRERWLQIRPKFEIEFEPLWNLKGTEKAQVDQTVVQMLRDLKADGVIPAEKVVEEINAKKIFATELNEDDIPDITETPYQNYDDIDTDKKIGELVNGSDNPQQSAKTGTEKAN
jgi:phage-related protein (TIGR01555 family)